MLWGCAHTDIHFPPDSPAQIVSEAVLNRCDFFQHSLPVQESVTHSFVAEVGRIHVVLVFFPGGSEAYLYLSIL